MIVKFLKPSTSFKGISYNFAKMLLDKGELMQVKNFHALQGLLHPRAEDYLHYLEALTKQSKRIVYPQMHVTLSTSGRTHSKEELTNIAEQWLQGMGYGEQPYLIVFHKDTQNNHVHLVSTRIGRDGKKINDSYEHVNGYKVLDRVMGVNSAEQVRQDMAQALAYRFSSRAQFMMLLEQKGYRLRLKNDQYEVYKFDTKQASVPVESIDQRISEYGLDKARLIQLCAIIEKYRTAYSPELYAVKNKLAGGADGAATGYTSELCQCLQQTFGLQLFFHAKDGKAPYGYTIIDHAQKAVYKGGELMPLAELLKLQPEPSGKLSPIHVLPDYYTASETFAAGKADYPIMGGIDDYSLPVPEPSTIGNFLTGLRINIADDIDDEQINGRNRRRKRKARTNTR
jgi:hypothetical protein